MCEFRIKTKTEYDGNNFILYYVVQKYRHHWIGSDWISIKSFKDRKDAIKLLKILMEYDY